MSEKESIEGESLGLEDLESKLASAHSAAKTGNRALAERLYLEIVASGVSDVRAYCNLGVLALLEKRSEEAVRWLEQAVQTDPDNAGSHLNLGMALQLEKRTAEAITVLRRAVSIDPPTEQN